MIAEIILAVIIIYIVSIILLAIKAIKGPTIGDQVLAIDVITYITVILFVLISIYMKSALLIVIAIPLALWIYALDIYIAKYLEKGDLGA